MCRTKHCLNGLNPVFISTKIKGERFTKMMLVKYSNENCISVDVGGNAH